MPHELRIDRDNDPLVVHLGDERDPLKIRQVEYFDKTGENTFPKRVQEELGYSALSKEVSIVVD